MNDIQKNNMRRALAILKALAKGKQVSKQFLLPVTGCEGKGCPVNSLTEIDIRIDYSEEQFSISTSEQYIAHGNKITYGGSGSGNCISFIDFDNGHYESDKKYLLDIILNPGDWKIIP